MTAPDQSQQTFLTVAEAEQFTRLSYDSLARAAKRGAKLGLLRVGARILFDRVKLESWLRGHGDDAKK